MGAQCLAHHKHLINNSYRPLLLLRPRLPLGVHKVGQVILTYKRTRGHIDVAFFVETASIFGIKHTSVCSPTLWFTWGKSCNLSKVNRDAVLLISSFPKMHEVPAYYVPGVVPGVGDKEIWKRHSPCAHSIAGETGRDHDNWENQELCQS